MIDTILLDLDGPLLEGKYRHYQCYADILVKYGYLPVDIDTYWSMKRKRLSRRELFAISCAEEIYDTFLAEWIQNIEQSHYLALDEIQAGAITQLQEWNKAGLNVYLVTMRSNEANLLDQLYVTGLASYLTSVIICAHSKGGVGKAEAVRQALPDIRSDSTLWVGDTEADCDGARSFGCPVWLLSCGLRTKAYLQTLKPDFLSDSINEVDDKKIGGLHVN